jgi:hypothetical protein
VTLRVLGGKAHQLVVEQVGVFASFEGIANDGAFIDAGEAAGGADSAAFFEVVEDLAHFVVGEMGVQEWGAFAFGEALLAGAASAATSLFVGAVAEGDAEVAVAAAAVIGALRVLATAAAEVVHRETHERVFRDTEKYSIRIIALPRKLGNTQRTPPENRVC